ncbi:Nitrogen permease regulator 2 [Ceratobasidium sp. UAMH 11750]|nr:Nitrogen permease regulator 2 [Ceratobasidium sp. UAMH 11750]
MQVAIPQYVCLGIDSRQMSSEAYIDESSFLPRIQSIFYAVFDPVKGPQIVYQVPEDAITTSHHMPYPPSAILSPTMNPVTSRSPSGSPFTSPPTLPTTTLPDNGTPSPAIIPPPQVPQPLPPTASRSSSQSRAAPNVGILDFDSISEYVIPKNELCGRLLHCNTPRHRILGFPVALRDEVYKRLWFRYNLCFVFDREADLSCYEPVVRKCGRVLMACEQESNFLSNSMTSWKMHSIIEQLYEDLNSYSETSIQVDTFNFFELKLFPFYPNPPAVNDWDVPVALINIEKRMDENWDLTMARVIRHVDGVNHVKKIAELADVDLELGRASVQHLLFYQCIIMTDIFQYTNIYALKSSIQLLANDPGVKEECPGYVTLPGHTPASWPDLLRLYSRLTNSKTVHEWLENCSSASTPRSPGPNSLGASTPDITSTIVPRRFISFGVIKGFVRRVRRWPVLLARRGRPRGPGRVLSGDQVEGIRSAFIADGSGKQHGDESASVGTIRAGSGGSAGAYHGGASGFERGPSGGSASTSMLSASIGATAGAMSTSFSPPTTRPSAHALLSSVAGRFPNATAGANGTTTTSSASASASGTATALSTSPVAPRGPRSTTQPGQISRARPGIGERERSDSTSTAVTTLFNPVGGGRDPALQSVPPELETLLDGTHHGDELCVRFGVNWQTIERWLSLLGGGNGTPEDMGRVRIIYR